MEKILEKSGKSQGILSEEKSGNPVMILLNFFQFCVWFIDSSLSPIRDQRTTVLEINDTHTRGFGLQVCHLGVLWFISSAPLASLIFERLLYLLSTDTNFSALYLVRKVSRNKSTHPPFDDHILLDAFLRSSEKLLLLAMELLLANGTYTLCVESSILLIFKLNESLHVFINFVFQTNISS